MLSFAAIVTVLKLVIASAASLFGILVGVFFYGRSAGQTTAATGQTRLQKEIARAEARGARTRADVVERLRRGTF